MGKPVAISWVGLLWAMDPPYLSMASVILTFISSGKSEGEEKKGVT